MVQDIRFGLRTLLKSPAHTLVVVLSLALGVGANTAVFSLVDGLLLKKLPVPQPDELVQIVRNTPAIAGQEVTFSYPQIERFRAAGALDGIFGGSITRVGAAFAGGNAELVYGQLVTGNFFAVLRVRPFLGRMLLPEDDVSGGAPVVVVSRHYWTNHLASDPSAIGRAVVVNGMEATIVGVAPEGFVGVSPPTPVEIWAPLHLQPRLTSARAWVDDPMAMRVVTMGRLKPGVSREQAQAILSVAFERLKPDLVAAASPEQKSVLARNTLQLISGATGYSGLRAWIGKSLLILLGLVAALLLIACANVAGLVLSRNAARQKELAIRLALGARRSRIVRQLFTESAMLAVCGGAAGLALGYGTKWLLARLIATGPFHMLLSLEGDSKIVLFTSAIALFAAFLFGLAPSAYSVRMNVNDTLKESSGRGATARFAFGKALVAAQVALSLALLLGAGLLIRTMINLQGVSLGFNPDRVLLASVDPAVAGYRGEPLARFNRQVRARLAALPGARSASLARSVPADGLSWPEVFSPDARPPESESMTVMRNWIGPDYFRTFSIPVLLGREFTERDDAQAPKVCIVNQAMARKYYGGQNPVGRALRLNRDPEANIEIVGVVADSRYDTVWKPPPPLVYTPYLQSNPAPMYFLVQAGGDPAALAGEVRTAIREEARNVPIIELVPMSDFIDGSLAQPRLMASVLSFFSLVGLVLVSVGLYALTSQVVTRRTREIGIRMALGASRAAVLRMLFREALLLVLAGIVAALPLTWISGKLLRTYLFQMSGHDPVTAAATASLLVVIAIAAVSVPALRACRVDPIIALRVE